jgi:hypothetical protein
MEIKLFAPGHPEGVTHFGRYLDFIPFQTQSKSDHPTGVRIVIGAENALGT